MKIRLLRKLREAKVDFFHMKYTEGPFPRCDLREGNKSLWWAHPVVSSSAVVHDVNVLGLV